MDAPRGDAVARRSLPEFRVNWQAQVGYSDAAMNRICLVMIVRDEAAVIERCLQSVRPVISSWSIVDTGSRDDTAKRIKRALENLPGQLHHRPWVDFGHNRSEALKLAAGKDDWLLLIDADEQLFIDADLRLAPDEPVDAWQILQQPAGSSNEFYLPRLLRSDHPWRFEGVLHEYLASTKPFRPARLEGWRQVGHFDGARNQQPMREKYLRDAAVLESALKSDPSNPRYRFYLAQSLRDAGEFERAVEQYRQRAEMGGWEEETYCALIEVARLLERTNAPHEQVAKAYLAAWNRRPVRAEPLTELARLHREREEHAIAHLFAEKAASLPRPDDTLFLDAGVYGWRAKDELAVASYWIGKPDTAIQLTRELLSSSALPDDQRTRVERNLHLFLNSNRG